MDSLFDRFSLKYRETSQFRLEYFNCCLLQATQELRDVNRSGNDFPTTSAMILIQLESMFPTKSKNLFHYYMDIAFWSERLDSSRLTNVQESMYSDVVVPRILTLLLYYCDEVDSYPNFPTNSFGVLGEMLWSSITKTPYCFEMCVLCGKVIGFNTVICKCSHSFHPTCLSQWEVLSSDCPVCR